MRLRALLLRLVPPPRGRHHRAEPAQGFDPDATVAFDPIRDEASRHLPRGGA